MKRDAPPQQLRPAYVSANLSVRIGLLSPQEGSPFSWKGWPQKQEEVSQLVHGLVHAACVESAPLGGALETPCDERSDRKQSENGGPVQRPEWASRGAEPLGTAGPSGGARSRARARQSEWRTGAGNR